MSKRRRGPFDRDTAEQLLGGLPTSRPAGGSDALADLLAAAAAPARNHELAREHEARGAFRAARLSPVTQPRRRPMIRTSLARVLTLKIAAVAAAALAAGGVALAAGTGHLPSHLGGANPAAHASPSGTGKPSSTDHPSATAMPSAALYGLCRAYTANVGTDPGKALESRAFTALIAAAGGKDNVSSFCAAVLSAGPGHKPSSHPTGKPSSHQAGKPSSSHPTGEPSSVRTGKPSSLPSQAPSSVPSHSPNH
jgi:hypothetical protein